MLRLPWSNRRTRRPVRRRTRSVEQLEPRRLLVADPIITEFMAENDGTLLDGDGQTSDWIEIFNAGDEGFDLAGWYLTDNADNLTKWTFPALQLGVGQYVVVFASGRPTDDYVDTAGHLHTNFKLSRDGEYLALVRPDGVTPVSQYGSATADYPYQFEDISYGQGLDRSETTVLGRGATAQVLVPSDDSLGTTWTQSDFSPGEDWMIGPSGAGFALEQPVSYWTFDDETVTDVVGPNHGVSIVRAGFSADAPAAGGDRSLDLTGGQHYVTLPATDYGIVDVYTISAWVKVTGSEQSFFSIKRDLTGGGTDRSGASLGVRNGKLYTGLISSSANDRANTGNTYHDMTTATSVPTEAWVHVAATLADDRVTMYINGVPETSYAGDDGSGTGRLKVTGTGIDLVDNDGSFSGFGADGYAPPVPESPGDNTRFFYEGLLDEVAVWDSALAAEQIAALADGTHTPLTVARAPDPAPPPPAPPASLISYWNFDDGSTATDQVGVNHGISFENFGGGPTHSNDVPAGGGTYSLDLRNGQDYVTLPATNYGITNQYTISAWVKAIDSERSFFSVKRDLTGGGGDRSGISLGVQSGGVVYTGLIGGGPSTANAGATFHDMTTTSVTVPTGGAAEWAHVAATFQGDFVTMYVNGVAETVYSGDGAAEGQLKADALGVDIDFVDANGSFSGFGADGNAPTVAGSPGDFTRFFYNGLLDEVAIWDVALPASSIGELAAGTPPPDVTVSDLPIPPGYIDINGYANRDLIGPEPHTAPNTAGWRGANLHFLAGTQPGDDDVNIPLSRQITAGVTFQLGPIDAAADVAEPQAVVVGVPGASVGSTSVEIDVPDANLSRLSVLHTALGFNVPATQTGNNGTLTIVYDSGLNDVLQWDVADHSLNMGVDPSGNLSRVALSDVGVASNGSVSGLDNSRLYVQDFEVDYSRQVDRLIFSVAGVLDAGISTGDAEFGLFALNGDDSPPQIVPPGAMDLGAAFNGDTIATDANDGAGVGFRSANEKFNAANFPTEPTRLLIAPDGTGFQFGPYNADNTVLLTLLGGLREETLGSNARVDLANGRYTEISFLHSGLGLNPADNTTNGLVTVNYTDGSSETFTWDVTDHTGLVDGDSVVALAGIGVADFDVLPAALPTSGASRIYQQTIEADDDKIVDAITFDTTGVIDGGGVDAEFAVYAVTVTGDVLTGEHGPYSGLIGIGLGEQMLGTDFSGVNASAYMRVPFEVGDPAQLGSLYLRMYYDDGFVAYLNGVEVARQNAPGDVGTAPAFDATATASRKRSEVIVYTEIDISQHVGLLLPAVVGQNVLAIHGLNEAADDVDFLILPELLDIELTAPGREYFGQPTPGGPNTDGINNSGPAIGSVQHTPNHGMHDQPIVVRAEITPGATPMAFASMTYRVMYGQEVTVPMVDDGTGDDAVAGDGTFTATIPASALGEGEMVRYFIRTEDTLGNPARKPEFFRPLESAEYFGTVIQDSDIPATQLPILEWFVEDPAWHRTGGGNNRDYAQVSAFYDGAFYDNLRVRVRGGVSFNAAKANFKFDFYNGGHFQHDPDQVKVEEFNLQSFAGEGETRTFLRNPVAYKVFRDSGTPSPLSFYVHVRQNGEFYSMAAIEEQVDERFLERNDFDPDGALYKAHYGAWLNTNPTANEWRKAIPEDNDFSDLTAFTAGLSLADPVERERFIFDNVNLPEVIHYLAVSILGPNHDRLQHNYYMYRDTYGTGEWSWFPWDLDRWFPQGGGLTNAVMRDVFYGDSDHLRAGTSDTNQYNRLNDAIFDIPGTREMYAAHVRTIVDEWMGTGTGYFEGVIDQFQSQIALDAAMDNAKWGLGNLSTGVAALKTTITTRRAQLNGDPEIPPAQGGSGFVTLVPGDTATRAFVPVDDSLGLTWTGNPANEPFPDGPIDGWIHGAGGVGYDTGTDYDPMIGTDVEAQMFNQYKSVFVRSAFSYDDSESFDQLLLRVRYDDGFVAYLNGTEIARSTNVPAGAPPFDVTLDPDANHEATAFEDFDVTNFEHLLLPGANTLAMHGINRTVDSTDMLIQPELVAVTSFTGGPVPDVAFGTIEGNPASGDQDEEYIELVNNESFAVDISEWQLTGGVEFTFQVGTVIPAGGTLYVSPDVVAFRGRAAGPTGGEGRFVQGNYSGHISNLGETIDLVDDLDQLIASVTTPFAPSPAQQFLRVSEIMYNPPAPTPVESAAGFVDNDDFEFIELVNTSETETLVLDGVSLTDGVTFDFVDESPEAETTLDPGERILVVRDLNAFAARYDTAGMNVAGPYRDPLDGSNNLNNDGEVVKLEDADNSTIHQFRYNDGIADGWPGAADGDGSSLEAINTEQDYDEAATWYASPEWGGTPGLQAGTIVLERVIFYNNSAFDTGGTRTDADAFAPDKTALLPGQTASFANYTSFSSGINGIAIDVAHPAEASQIELGDFAFHVGRDDDPSSWLEAPTPVVTVQPDAGRGGSSRILLTWPDEAIVDQWLQVTVQSASLAIGLASDDVFYFGNAIGETGNDSDNTLVNAADAVGARDNPRGALNPATVTDRFDFNRDGAVDAVDMILARNHATSPLSGLRLITSPLPAPVASGPAEGAAEEPDLVVGHVANLAGNVSNVPFRDRLFAGHLSNMPWEDNCIEGHVSNVPYVSTATWHDRTVPHAGSRHDRIELHSTWVKIADELLSDLVRPGPRGEILDLF